MSSPGVPTAVTTPRPVETAVPVVLLYWGTLPTVVDDGTESEPLPLPEPHAAPASTTLPLASHLAQLPDAPAPVEVMVLVPEPVKDRGA